MSNVLSGNENKRGWPSFSWARLELFETGGQRDQSQCPRGYLCACASKRVQDLSRSFLCVETGTRGQPERSASGQG